MPPVPHVPQPFEAALPSDFEQWPAPMRAVWRDILALSAWRSNGWAPITIGPLGERVARVLNRPKCPHATVRRWLTWLADRGEFARRTVHRGEPLPDGSVAWCDHWVVVPGDAMKARAGTAPSMIRGVIMNDHPSDHGAPPSRAARSTGFSAGSGAPESEVPPRPPPREAPFKNSPLSSRSGSGSRSESLKLRSKLGESGDETKVSELAPPVRMLAERLLRHYATASGVRVVHFRASSRAIVAACLDEMEGDDAAREMRLRAVIASAIAESQTRGIAHPPLAYVFNVRHVRRRLERLAEAEHLAQKTADADAGGDMFAAGFDGALADARTELAAGVEPKALERARPFVDNRLVTDAARVAAFHELAKTRRGTLAPPPLARAARPAPKRVQDAPQRDLHPLGSATTHGGSGDVSGPEDALRALAALFETVTDPSPAVRAATEVPLTAAERTALEAAQELARARWARAG
jgi:hypothetical protein